MHSGAETDHIFDCMDQNANETVSFNEFVATMDARAVIRQLNQAYRLLDKDQGTSTWATSPCCSASIMQDVAEMAMGQARALRLQFEALSQI